MRMIGKHFDEIMRGSEIFLCAFFFLGVFVISCLFQMGLSTAFFFSLECKMCPCETAFAIVIVKHEWWRKCIPTYK
jgi:hypothetical protein